MRYSIAIPASPDEATVRSIKRVLVNGVEVRKCFQCDTLAGYALCYPFPPRVDADGCIGVVCYTGVVTVEMESNERAADDK